MFQSHSNPLLSFKFFLVLLTPSYPAGFKLRAARTSTPIAGLITDILSSVSAPDLPIPTIIPSFFCLLLIGQRAFSTGELLLRSNQQVYHPPSSIENHHRRSSTDIERRTIPSLSWHTHHQPHALRSYYNHPPASPAYHNNLSLGHNNSQPGAYRRFPPAWPLQASKVDNIHPIYQQTLDIFYFISPSFKWTQGLKNTQFFWLDRPPHTL